MVDIQSSIQGLQEKLQLFIKQHAALQKEHQQLLTKLSQKEEQAAQLEQLLKDNQSKLTAAMMNKASIDPAEKEKWVKQIDQYLKEIDHCINNLNP
jgi:succinate dehydrogenase flavin-adding protein (antitoxin of CptAB toxin-antitoxin module)